MILEKIASAAVPPVEIATDRFTLRPVRKSDAGLFALYAGDKRVAEATQGIPHPLPPGAAEAFCTRAMAFGGEEEIPCESPPPGQGMLQIKVRKPHSKISEASSLGFNVRLSLCFECTKSVSLSRGTCHEKLPDVPVE